MNSTITIRAREGYMDANVVIAALRRTGRELDTEKLVGVLETLYNLDVGVGTPVSFSRSDHQCKKSGATQLDDTGRYQPIDLE